MEYSSISTDAFIALTRALRMLMRMSFASVRKPRGNPSSAVRRSVKRAHRAVVNAFTT